MEELVFDHYLDLRGTPCPTNFVRCSLALEKLSFTKILKVDLDKGEPEKSVVSGLQENGYKVKIINTKSDWITLIVSCGHQSY